MPKKRLNLISFKYDNFSVSFSRKTKKKCEKNKNVFTGIATTYSSSTKLFSLLLFDFVVPIVDISDSFESTVLSEN